MTKRTADNREIMKWVGVMSVVFKPGRRKPFTKATDMVGAAPDTFAVIEDPAANVSTIEEKIFEEEQPQDLRDFTSKVGRGPFAMQRVQELFQTHDLSVPYDVRSEGEVTENTSWHWLLLRVMRRQLKI